MNPISKPFSIKVRSLWLAPVCVALCISSCKQKDVADLRIKQLDSTEASAMAKSVESIVKPVLADGLTLKLWGVDSLVISPIAIDVDDYGNLYYTTTNRQKNSEFDIRGHRDWEIESISLQTIEDKRAFLRKTLSPENSSKNTWLADLNGDSSHDWRDMTIEKENVYRLEDTNGDGIADKSQLVVDDFNDEVTDVAGGVMKEGDDLFVAVGPDLWRMKDKNGDGIADEKTSISHGYGIHIGFGGHGMSGIEMGPDGKVYWQIGDIGFNGKGPDGQKWEYPNSGVIVRSNPDGSDFEVFAAGLRNTHEFVFDEYGNLISEDNDGDHPGERERLVYVVNGSDAGWRSNWQYGKYRDPLNNTYKVWMDEKMYLPRWEGQAAYITPCISNYVSGPTGMLYNPGTALGPEYKNSFFIAEFVGNPSASGIHSFKLKPKGATFELGDQKKVLSGVLATGMEWGPDGSMYIADWIDGWGTHDYGRIWKMDVKDGESQSARIETKKLLAEDFSKRNENDLGGFLTNADMRVRLKAQFELATRAGKGADVFKNYLQQKDNQLARVHAIWGISQLARKEKKYAEALLPYLKDGDPEIRAQVARWLGDIRYREAGDAIIPLLKDEYSRARFFAAEALGRIQHAAAVQPVIAFLQANNDEDAYLRHAGSLALARIGQADPLVALSGNPSRALRIAAVVALRRMGHPGISVFLKDSDEFVVTEAARAINDDLSIEKSLPDLGNILMTTPFKNEALIRRAINANLRTGTDEALKNLVAYAQRADAPPAMRAEAIDALSTWAQPSVLDRVDGRFRGEISRDLKGLTAIAAEPIMGLLKTGVLPVQLTAIKAMARMKVSESSAKLHEILKKDTSSTARVEALQALVELKDNQLDQAIRAALADKDKTVRVAGLDILENLNLSGELMTELLADVIKNRTMEEKQAAILSLGKVPLNHSGKLFDELLNNMESGKLGSDVLLELGEAIDSTKSADLIARYKKISSSKSPDELMASYSSSLMGGDPNRGRAIFFRNQNAQCMRCHAYDDRGGNAGPRLNGVGARLTREQLLESLINPGARLAPGYGVVMLELKSGEKISGTLMGENKSGITIKVGDEPQKQIPFTQIAKRENAPSSMPDMKAILSKREIRHVVSFLATLKEQN